jgi:hypothetical protein
LEFIVGKKWDPATPIVVQQWVWEVKMAGIDCWAMAGSKNSHCLNPFLRNNGTLEHRAEKSKAIVGRNFCTTTDTLVQGWHRTQQQTGIT